MNKKICSFLLTCALTLTTSTVVMATPITNQTEFRAQIGSSGSIALDLLNDISFNASHNPLMTNAVSNMMVSSVSPITLTGVYSGATAKQNYHLIQAMGTTHITLNNPNSPLTVTGFGVTGGAAADTSGLVANVGQNRNKTDSNNSYGRGGAIFTNGEITITDGNYAFTNNTAQAWGSIANSTFARATGTGSVASSVTSTDDSGRGGALFAGDTFTITNGTYQFLNNTAHGGGATAHSFRSTATTDNANTLASSNAQRSGRGGAIYAFQNMNITNGTYTFSGNQATGVSTTANSSFTTANGVLAKTSASANGELSAYGGALYVGQNLTIDNGTFTFSNNGALGAGAVGKSSDSDSINDPVANPTGSGSSAFAYTRNSGYGGAIYAGNSLTLNNGTYTFSNNTAMGGEAKAESTRSSANGQNSFSSANVLANNSGHGGAIYSTNALTFTNGTYQFTGNKATGGDAFADATNSRQVNGGDAGAYADTHDSGHGGAIYAAGPLTIVAGTYMFSGNTATGGKSEATYTGGLNRGIARAQAQNSGLGGAIYSSSDINLSGTITFSNNSATTTNNGDMTSGRGGAIFADAINANTTHNFTVNSGQNIIFQDNTQNIGNTGITPNGMYFGNTATAANRTTTMDIVTNDTGSVQIFDSIASQQDNLTDLSGTVYSNLNLTINKTGTGAWLLGGISQLNSETTININQGRFELYYGGQVNLNHATTGRFTTTAGTVFKPYLPVNGETWINAHDIDIVGGTIIEIGGISSLQPGDHAYYNVLHSPTGGVLVDGSVNGSILNNSVMLYELALIGDSGPGTYGHLFVRGLKSMGEAGFEDILETWRQNNLDDCFRDPLDDFYLKGSMSDEYAGQLKDLGQQLYGREILSSIYMTNSNLQGFRNRIDQRLSASNAFGIEVASYTDAQQPVLLASNGSTEGLLQKETAPSYSHNLWVSAAQRWSKQNSHRDVYGYEYNPMSLTAGYDFKSENWLFGASLQYDEGKAKSLNSSRVKSELEGFIVGLYAGYDTEDWYVNAGIQYGQSENDVTSRFNYIGCGTKTYGSFDVDFWGANVEAGLPQKLEDWSVVPHIGASFARYNMDGFKEKGDPNFTRNFKSNHYTVVEFPIGVMISKEFTTSGGMALIPALDLVYAPSVADAAASTTGHFTNMSDRPFEVEGLYNYRHIFRGDLGLTARLTENVEMSGIYNLEARKDFISQQVNFQVKFTF